MVSDIEFLEAVYERMQQVGLVHSKADFSTRMLGKAPSYLTSMSARDRQVPDDVIEHLARQLVDETASGERAIAALHDKLQAHEQDNKHRAELLHRITRRSIPSSDGAGTQRLLERRCTLIERLAGLLGRVHSAWAR